MWCRIIIMLIFSFVVAFGVEYKPLLTNENGVLPSSSNFFDANSDSILNTLNGFKRDFRIFIDTQPAPASNSSYKTLTSYKTTVATSGSSTSTIAQYSVVDKVWNLQYWTDCEIKVIDKWGNIVYFTSTICLNNSQVRWMHPDITDLTVRVYYWSSEGDDNWCYGKRCQLTNFDSSIGNDISSYDAVCGIWIYPSVNSTEVRNVFVYTGRWSGSYQNVEWGKYVRSVFENPENTVIAWRQTTSNAEYYNGNKLWRPVRIEHYGAFHK